MFLNSFNSYLLIAAYFLQAYIACLLFFITFKKRKLFYVRFIIGSLVSFGLFLLLAPITSKLLSGFIVGGRTTLSFLILLILFYVSFDRKFIDCLYCTVAGILTQNIAANMFDIFRGLLKMEKYDPLNIFMFLSLIITYVIVWFLCCRKLKNLENITVNKIITMCVSVGAYFVVCFFFMKISEHYAYNDEMFIYGRIICLICDSFALYIMFSDLTKRYLISENLVIEKMMEEAEKRYKLESQTVEMINIKCHDLKHKINDNNLNSKDEKEEKSEVEELIATYESLASTGNQIIDIIISKKAIECNKNDICFTYQIDGEALSFMKKTDISALLGNILDNAIEYLIKVEEKEKRILNMKIFKNKGMVGMHIENFCDSKIDFKNGLPVSTKNDNFYHGFGTKSIKYIVNKYEGNTEISLKDNLYSIDIIIPIPIN